MAPVGAVTRTLTDSDPGFSPETLKLAVSAPLANDITVIGETEPAMYWRDCITATGSRGLFLPVPDGIQVKNRRFWWRTISAARRWTQRSG